MARAATLYQVYEHTGGGNDQELRIAHSLAKCPRLYLPPGLTDRSAGDTQSPSPRQPGVHWALQPSFRSKVTLGPPGPLLEPPGQRDTSLPAVAKHQGRTTTRLPGVNRDSRQPCRSLRPPSGDNAPGILADSCPGSSPEERNLLVAIH